ncbi:MAG: GIN domain-containing protein [Marinifilaceae bacterium]
MKFTLCLFMLLCSSTIFAQKEKVVQEERAVKAFNKIHVSSALPVDVCYASEHRVEVFAVDDERLKEIRVQVLGDCLYLSVKEPKNKKSNWLYIEGKNNDNSRRNRDKVKIYLPELIHVTQDGASSVSLLGNWQMDALEWRMSGASRAVGTIQVKKLSVDLSGASRVIFQGTAHHLVMGLTGASTGNLLNVLSKNASVHCSGASTAKVYADEQLNASCTGASSVRYSGKCAVEMECTGASSVKRIN